MSDLNLSLETRTETGKGVAKKLRREAKIPGVYYFHGEESVPFSVDRKAIQTLIGHESALIDITFDGKSNKKCVIRELQFDPLTSQPIHIDLLGIKMTEKISVTVPVHLIGTPEGVKTGGGVLQHQTREIEIQCLPSDIPDSIEVDIAELEIGDGAFVSDIDIENVEILSDSELVIANVVAPRLVEEETVAEEEELEEGAEPELVGKEEDEE